MNHKHFINILLSTTLLSVVHKMEKDNCLSENHGEDKVVTYSRSNAGLKNMEPIPDFPDVKEDHLTSSIPQSNQCQIQGFVGIKTENKYVKQENEDNMDIIKGPLKVQSKEEYDMSDIKKSDMDMIRSSRKYQIISRKVEPGTKRFVCSICGKREKCTSSVKTHLLKHHNYIEPPYQKIIHECTKCEFSSGQTLDVVKHMANIHNSTELFSRCHLCEYKSKQSGDVKHHIRITHLKMYVKCEQCDFTAAKKTTIRKHV